MLTAANLAFVAKTGTIEVASAGWKVAGWVTVVVCAVAFIAVLVRLLAPWAAEIRRTYGQRIDGPARGAGDAYDDWKAAGVIAGTDLTEATADAIAEEWRKLQEGRNG